MGGCRYWRSRLEVGFRRRAALDSRSAGAGAGLKGATSLVPSSGSSESCVTSSSIQEQKRQLTSFVSLELSSRLGCALRCGVLVTFVLVS